MGARLICRLPHRYGIMLQCSVMAALP